MTTKTGHIRTVVVYLGVTQREYYCISVINKTINLDEPVRALHNKAGASGPASPAFAGPLFRPNS